MPEIDSKARDQLLLHQFIAGLPLRVSRELRAAGETKELGVTLQRARLLLSLEDQHKLTESGPLGSSTKQPNEREQAMAASIDRLTQQVAALSEQTGSHSKVLSPGKLQRGACSGQHAPRHPVGPSKVISVAAVKSKIATLMGSVGDTAAEIMLDSGSSVSLLRQELAQKATGVVRTQPRQEIRLVTAAGESLPILSANQESAPPIKPIWTAERLFKTKKCPVASIGETMEDANQEMTEECAIPKFGSPPKVEFPEIIKTCFVTVVDKFKDLFVTTPGTTSLASHRITTAGTPVRVPSRRIPVHFREEVEVQIQQLLEKGIITESSSPWLAPAVYVRKKTGDIRLCVDYRELNKKTTKDAYPLPLIDEVQDQLSGSAVFSKLDLQSGYWQLPVDPNDREKTAFSPGSGVTPDREKVKAVEEWPIPQNATEVRQFLGLASYYRRFIQNFADVAAPLHNLTQKDAVFSWSNDCSRAFKTLKCKLIGAPILVYPRVDKEASQFQLQTDASALGLGAVLEQGGHVIAYASRILTKAEANYSFPTVDWLSEQRMGGMLCRWALALQEYNFTVEYRKGSHNDNADALSRRRETVGRASHLAATRSTTGVLAEQIRIAQQKDDIIQQVYQALRLSVKQPTGTIWRKSPFSRYHQLWSQLKLREGVVYRTYIPGPTSEAITVPVLPACLRKEYLRLCHDSATGGHQGWHKTLHKLRREAYWVNMAQDADQHCRECNICQRTKPTAPKRAPLINIPVGRPWQMVAVDILEVPVSSNNNRYILVVQDYFTKWADARPIPDQTAVRITRELVHIFAGYGIPEIIHSDQGRNFESTIFQQTMAAFGVKKTRTTAYHPQGDGMVERFNRTLLQLLRAYVDQQNEWEKYLPLALYAYRTSTHTSTSVSPFELMFGRQPKDHTEGQTGLRHRIQMAEGEEGGSTDRTQGEWVPPQIEHITVEGTPPQGPEPDLENNDQPIQPEEPIQRSLCELSDSIHLEIAANPSALQQILNISTVSFKKHPILKLWEVIPLAAVDLLLYMPYSIATHKHLPVVF
eukprot:Em0016g609a